MIQPRENNSMKPVAFLILAHTDPELCTRLVRRLLMSRTAIVFIHVDQKTKTSFASVEALDPSRVKLVRQRVEISWSGYSMVKATLGAMREALESSVDWGYLVLLSGLDYPIQPVEAIEAYLYGQSFKQHINRVNVADSPEHYLKMVSAYNFRDAILPIKPLDKALRKMLSLAARPIKRTLLPGTLCTGSSWWALTREFVTYTLDLVGEHTEYERFFRFTYAADEYFFHTLVQNSPFVGEASPLSEYRGRGMWKTANLHIVHPSLQKIYAEDDFEDIMRSDKYFVRKVTSAKSRPLLDKIDAKIDAALGSKQYEARDREL